MHLTHNVGFWCGYKHAPDIVGKIFPSVNKKLTLDVTKYAARIGLYDWGLFIRYESLFYFVIL
ncbi:hypothetical protein FACS1894211_10570 [Clostridia bacterium]|nr:hypothetical protein FACS1894211_10570 [Clostridia bacterium]